MHSTANIKTICAALARRVNQSVNIKNFLEKAVYLMREFL